LTAAGTCAYNALVVNDDVPAGADSSSQPPTTSSGTEDLDFDKATYIAPVATRTCAGCKQIIPSEYFETAGQVICGRCRDQLLGATPDRWAFPRALLFGGLVGAAGTVVWSLIIHFTGYELGLIAIVVGIGVGIAVRKGSRGRGGWRYQTLAMALTYVSITTSYVPLILKSLVKGAGDQISATAMKYQKNPGDAPTRVADERGAGPGNVDRAARDSNENPSLPLPIALLAFAGLVWSLALAAPFLAGTSNIMGIIIIGIGLYEAWKYNRRMKVSGPFKLAPVVPAAPGGTASP